MRQVRDRLEWKRKSRDRTRNCGTPFDTGFAALQNLFTGTIAKVASLIAIVIGGYGLFTADQVQRRHLVAAPQVPASLSSPATSQLALRHLNVLIYTAFAQLLHDPGGAIGELRTQLTYSGMKTLLRAQIDRAQLRRV